MTETLVEVWRGGMVECVHAGHAVVVDAAGQERARWGNPETVIFPRSSCKMLQALPLVESGAAAGLTTEHLALACASHQGAGIHTERVTRWLDDMGLGEKDLRCGAQTSSDLTMREAMRQAGEAPDQRHNNCSGKHTGFLHLTRHLKAGPEYIELDHPVQVAAKAAFEEMTGETSPRHGIDGCSAPNFACTLSGLARAMARMATPGVGVRGDAATQLVEAMMAHPDLVAGEGRACTELMRAMNGVAVKTGAEGVFTAILPKQGLGVALKISDGATRAAEAAMAAILVGLGVLDEAHPSAQRRMAAEVRNRRDILTGHVRAVPMLSQPI